MRIKARDIEKAMRRLKKGEAQSVDLFWRDTCGPIPVYTMHKAESMASFTLETDDESPFWRLKLSQSLYVDFNEMRENAK